MANLDFPQSNRLKKKLHFDYLIENKKKISTDYFLLFYTDCKENERKVAFSVGKKVSKKAVERNTLRRRLKEVFRINQHNINKRYDMLIIAKPEMLKCSFDQLNKDLEEVMDKIGLWIQ